MKFSLVLGTLGRTTELARFVSSLAHQGDVPCELIVVDQNPDDRVMPLLSLAPDCVDVKHIRQPQPGLSRARNAGLRLATGDVVAFPDDDCWYPPGLLARVRDWFAAHPDHDGLSGRCVDDSGRAGLVAIPDTACELDAFHVWTRAISITVFLRREVIERVGGFDESLGVGSGTPWGSGEETDYMLRTLGSGFRIACEPAIAVGHPSPTAGYGPSAWRRALAYGAGMGRVLRKHRAPAWQRGWMLFRATGGIVLGVVRLQGGEARFHWNSLRGRWRGLFAGPPP